jgi:hypothetical protein
LVVANFRDNIPKLTSWYKFQEIIPIFQWKLTEIVWSYDSFSFPNCIFL